MNMSNSSILRSQSMLYQERISRIQFLFANLLRYIFNPAIDGYIDSTTATLNLAICCIWYLCQSHHDSWISDDEITQNLISGDYRLDSYAATMWLDLVERHISLRGSNSLPSELIRALDCLARDRTSSECTVSTELVDQSQKPYLKQFEDEWPKIHTLLSNMIQFHWRCSNFEYRMSKGASVKS